MSKHTKGPWVWVGDRLEAPGEDVLGVDDDGKSFGLHSAILVESENPERAAANRSLIAAAPDLLEALKRCRFDSLNMSLADLDFCRAAFVKATGAAS